MLNIIQTRIVSILSCQTAFSWTIMIIRGPNAVDKGEETKRVSDGHLAEQEEEGDATTINIAQ